MQRRLLKALLLSWGEQNRGSKFAQGLSGGIFGPRLRRFNAEAQRFAEVRRGFYFSAFLRVPLRLCVKTCLGFGGVFAPLRAAPQPGLRAGRSGVARLRGLCRGVYRTSPLSRQARRVWLDGLGRLPVHPFGYSGWSVVAQFDQQLARIIAPEQCGKVLLLDESLLRHVVEELEEPGVIVVHIQEGAWLGMEPELGPCDHLEDLLQAFPTPPGSATKASASSAIFSFRSCMESTRCSLVKPWWATSRGHHPFRDYADDFTAGLESTVGERAHQADVSAAIDQGEAFRSDQAAEGLRRSNVGGVQTRARSAIDTQ